MIPWIGHSPFLCFNRIFFPPTHRAARSRARGWIDRSDRAPFTQATQGYIQRRELSPPLGRPRDPMLRRARPRNNAGIGRFAPTPRDLCGASSGLSPLSSPVPHQPPRPLNRLPHNTTSPAQRIKQNHTESTEKAMHGGAAGVSADRSLKVSWSVLITVHGTGLLRLARVARDDSVLRAGPGKASDTAGQHRRLSPVVLTHEGQLFSRPPDRSGLAEDRRGEQGARGAGTGVVVR